VLELKMNVNWIANNYKALVIADAGTQLDSAATLKSDLFFVFNDHASVPPFLKVQAIEISFERPNYIVACDPQSIARKWLLIGAFA